MGWIAIEPTGGVVVNTAQHAVIATFNSPGQAEQAANDLLDWEKDNPDIKLGAIGVITRNNKGELKTRSWVSEIRVKAPESG